MQDLNFVPAAIAENKEGRGKRIELERLAAQRRQTGNRLADVRAAASQVDTLHSQATDQHEPNSTFTTPRRRAGANPGRTSTMARPMWIRTALSSIVPSAAWRSHRPRRLPWASPSAAPG